MLKDSWLKLCRILNFLDGAHAWIIPSLLINDVRCIIPLLERLGFEEHLKTNYGDEDTYRSPWEIFNRDDAIESLDIAKKCVEIAKRVYKFYFG